MFLSTLRAHRGQRRLALAIVLVSAAVFAALAPFAQTPLPVVPAFIPVYQSALSACDLLTAALLFGQFDILRSRAVLVLACAYLFGALMAMVHMFTFPGLFSPTGLLGSGAQSTAWLYMFWHGGFSALVIAYALLQDRQERASLRDAFVGIAGVAAAVAGFALLATAGEGVLPAIMREHHYSPTMATVVSLVWMLGMLALAVLWRRRPRTVLDLWLMVVMCAWLCDIALAAVLNAGRYDLGFYAGRLYGLLAATFVLIVLLLENGVLYARLTKLNAQLEGRVAARTAELETLNRDLRQEVAQRTLAQEALRRSRQDLQEMAAVGATAREQEKARIARELHDELAQTLAALKMHLVRLVESGSVGDPQARTRIAAMSQLLDDLVAATRRIASDLRPLLLDDLGLVAAAEWLVANFTERYGIPCELVVDPPHLDLDDPHSTAVFRILQECLSNIARHAAASHVEVHLSRADGQVRLRVTDDGRGFDPGSPRKLASFGLTGMHERVHLVSGEIEIDAQPGRGTTIEVRIPEDAAFPEAAQRVTA